MIAISMRHATTQSVHRRAHAIPAIKAMGFRAPTLMSALLWHTIVMHTHLASTLSDLSHVHATPVIKGMGSHLVQTLTNAQCCLMIVMRKGSVPTQSDHSHARAVMDTKEMGSLVPMPMNALCEHTIVTRMRLALILSDRFNAAATRDSLALAFNVNPTNASS